MRKLESPVRAARKDDDVPSHHPPDALVRVAPALALGLLWVCRHIRVTLQLFDALVVPWFKKDPGAALKQAVCGGVYVRAFS